MGSPVRTTRHAWPAHLLAAWLAAYEFATPGLRAGHNGTLRLDLDNEPQPDLMLWVPEAAGGRAHVDADDYLTGPPELVIEVAATSTSKDLHQKRDVYRRNGVPEYLVHRVEDAAVDWFLLEQSAYSRQQPDPHGCLHSRIFPGLCLDVAALLRGDLTALRTAVERATATEQHAAFVQRLRSTRPDSTAS